MAQERIYHELFELIRAIEDDPAHRVEFRDDLTATIGKMKSAGLKVPAKLSALEQTLLQEEQELLFENMPI